jgi:hypothetical protein
MSKITAGIKTAADYLSCRLLPELLFRQGQVKAVVEPDSVTDDIWRESVTLVSIHSPILAIMAS